MTYPYAGTMLAVRRTEHYWHWQSGIEMRQAGSHVIGMLVGET